MGISSHANTLMGKGADRGNNIEREMCISRAKDFGMGHGIRYFGGASPTKSWGKGKGKGEGKGKGKEVIREAVQP